jgi:hypothetical protein
VTHAATHVANPVATHNRRIDDMIRLSSSRLARRRRARSDETDASGVMRETRVVLYLFRASPAAHLRLHLPIATILQRRRAHCALRRRIVSRQHDNPFDLVDDVDSLRISIYIG